MEHGQDIVSESVLQRSGVREVQHCGVQTGRCPLVPFASGKFPYRGVWTERCLFVPFLIRKVFHVVEYKQNLVAFISLRASFHIVE